MCIDCLSNTRTKPVLVPQLNTSFFSIKKFEIESVVCFSSGSSLYALSTFLWPDRVSHFVDWVREKSAPQDFQRSRLEVNNNNIVTVRVGDSRIIFASTIARNTTKKLFAFLTTTRSDNRPWQP